LVRPDTERAVPRLPQGAHVVVGAVLDVDAVRELLRRRHRVPRVSLGSRLSGLARLRPDDGARRAADVRLRDVRDSGRRGQGDARMRRIAAVLVVAGLALPAGLARADDAPAPAPATGRPGAPRAAPRPPDPPL